MFNKAVEDFRMNSSTNAAKIRKRITIKKKDITSEHKDYWLQSIPYDTRDAAIQLMASNAKTGFTLLKKGLIKRFQMNFQSKKRNNEIFIINRKAIDKKFNIFKKKFDKQHSKLKLTKKSKKWIKKHLFAFETEEKKLDKYLAHNAVITRNKAGEYYIVLPHKKINTNNKKSSENIVSSSEASSSNAILDVKSEKDIKLVALDPGVRTFQTYYSEFEHGKLGNNIQVKLGKYNKKIDNLTSKITSKDVEINKNMTNKQRYKLKKRLNKLRIKVKNIVSNLHWQSASYLVKNFDVILLPTFKTKKMSENTPARKLNNTTVRNMMNLSHFCFKSKIKHLATFHGKQVIECDESYTSKTCGNCGVLHEKLKGSKTFNCQNCKISIDRDVNGARNIFIRSLTKYFK